MTSMVRIHLRPFARTSGLSHKDSNRGSTAGRESGFPAKRQARRAIPQSVPKEGSSISAHLPAPAGFLTKIRTVVRLQAARAAFQRSDKPEGPFRRAFRRKDHPSPPIMMTRSPKARSGLAHQNREAALKEEKEGQRAFFFPTPCGEEMSVGKKGSLTLFFRRSLHQGIPGSRILMRNPTQVSYGRPGRGIKLGGCRQRHYKSVRLLRRF